MAKLGGDVSVVLTPSGNITMTDSIPRVAKIVLLLFSLTFLPVLFVDADDVMRDHEEIIEEYRAVLSELLLEPPDTTTLKEIGKISFYLGQETHDRDSIKKAVSLFKEILKREPDNAEITAFLGSAYTLKARDFPMKWLANVTPLGLMRLFYVKKGISLLNHAVEMDGMHPIIRLIRGLTYVHLPRIFSQFDRGIKDLELVVSWVEKQSLNEEYSDLIADKAFMGYVSYYVGEVYQRRGEYDRARVFFKKVTALLPDTPIGRTAAKSVERLELQD